MNRAQFMEQLEKLLSDISEIERNEALEYYESYFDDAGVENEASVIRELGSPGKVAAIIKADLRESSEDYGEYTERGYEDTRTKEPDQMPEKYRSRRKHSDREEKGYHSPRRGNQARVILILILLVFLFPFIKGAVGSVLGVLVMILLLPFLLALVLGAGTIVMAIAGVACIVAGIGICAMIPAVGVLTIGIGCLMITLGILLLLLFVWIALGILPKLIRRVTDFCNRLLCREKKEKVL